MSLSLHVKERALAAGFDLAGVAPLAAWRDLEFAREWVEKGYAGEMQYLRNPKRADPRLILPSARSVVCVGLIYNAPLPYSTEVGPEPSAAGSKAKPKDARCSKRPRTDDQGHGTTDQGLTASDVPRAWISRYAWGRDYHEVMRERLERLRADIQALAPGIEMRVYVDTGPIIERAFARLSGIGWTGKNACLINEEKGSWFFLGVILTSLDLEPDLPASDRCGSCTRCLDACPTGALVEPYVMDASRCIAYFNIELKGSIPLEYRAAMGANVMGCDICQDVCPWNRGSHQLSAPGTQASAIDEDAKTPARSRRQVAKTEMPEFQPLRLSTGSRRTAHPQTFIGADTSPCTHRPAFSLFHPSLQALASFGEEEFRRAFARSPVKRVKYRGFLRNLCVVMGNSGDARFVPWLERLREGDDPLLREHAGWAIDRLKVCKPGNSPSLA